MKLISDHIKRFHEKVYCDVYFGVLHFLKLALLFQEKKMTFLWEKVDVSGNKYFTFPGK